MRCLQKLLLQTVLCLDKVLATINNSRKYSNWGMIIQIVWKTLLFTALHKILLCEVCVIIFHFLLIHCKKSYKRFCFAQKAPFCDRLIDRAITLPLLCMHAQTIVICNGQTCFIYTKSTMHALQKFCTYHIWGKKFCFFCYSNDNPFYHQSL